MVKKLEQFIHNLSVTLTLQKLEIVCNFVTPPRRNYSTDLNEIWNTDKLYSRLTFRLLLITKKYMKISHKKIMTRDKKLDVGD